MTILRKNMTDLEGNAAMMKIEFDNSGSVSAVIQHEKGFGRVLDLHNLLIHK